jgi:hypothetical protein
VTVADREVLRGSGREWYADGTAGEADRTRVLAAVAPAWAMGEARPGRHLPSLAGSEGDG